MGALGLSTYNEMVGPSSNCKPTCTGGIFKGWTFASARDVRDLFDHAGLPTYVIDDPRFHPDVVNQYDSARACFGFEFEDPRHQLCVDNVQKFFLTIGPIGTDYGDGAGSGGITSTLQDDLPYDGDPTIGEIPVYPMAGNVTCCALSGVATQYDPASLRLVVGKDGLVARDRPDFLLSQTPVWLYRVPEPSGIALIGLALGIVIYNLGALRRSGKGAQWTPVLKTLG